MASTVQQHRALSPAAVRVSRVPALSCINSGVDGRLCGKIFGELSGCTSSSQHIASIDANLPRTPCSNSSNPHPEHSSRDSVGDPVVLLTRPVEGFHHPRQHLFTDRLVGRFFEDSSLDAETRKINKCLAGRLGTAGTAGCGTRPGTATSGAALSHCQSHLHNTPAGDNFGGTWRARRIQGSSSSASLGSSGGRASKGHGATRPQRAGCTALSARKEQVEKEIMEQKALIEKLEGRMASLSSRGRAGERKMDSIRDAAVEDGSSDFGESGQVVNNVCRPASTLESLRQSYGEEKDLDTEQEKALKIQSFVRGKQARSRAQDIRADAVHLEARSMKSATVTQATKHGSVARQEQQEADSTVKIQRNMQGGDQRRKSLPLQSAREELDLNLNFISSLAGSLAVETGGEMSTCDLSLPGRNGNIVGRVSSAEGAARAVVARLIETNREDGLVKPPFEPLRSMYCQFGELEDTLSLLVTAVNGTGHVEENTRAACGSLMEYFAAAEVALDRIKDALGVRDDELQTVRRSPAASATAPMVHAHRLPAGSGRAVAVAVASASGKGGILVSPEQLELSPRSTVSNALCLGNEAPAQGAERRGRMKLSSLSVEGIGRLLRANGFRDDAAGFMSQAVDGAMLSDPNLCEADFRELGLGGTTTPGGATGDGTSIARLLAFFKACQKDGVVEPTAEVDHGDKGFGRRSEQAGLGEKVSSNTDGWCGEAAGPAVEPGGPLQEATPAKSAVVPESDSYGGDLWRRGSIDLDRENQTVLANISFDQFEEKEERMSTPPLPPAAGAGLACGESTAGGRRISVKHNNGVVVTVGGLQPALVTDVDGLENVDACNEWGDVERGKSSATIDGTDRFLGKGSARKASLGLTAVVLDVEVERSATPQRRLAKGPREGLPPEMVVKTGGSTIDVFDSHIATEAQESTSEL